MGSFMNASDVEVTMETSSLGGPELAEVAFTGRATHLPAGPMWMAEAALGPAGNVAGGWCAKLKAGEP